MPPLKVFFLLVIFESFFVIYVGTKLFNIEATRKQLMLITILYSLIAFIMRFDGIFGHIIKYGVHTLIIIVSLTIIMGLVLKIPFRISFVAIAVPIIFIILGDGILLVPVMKHFGMIQVTDFPKHPWTWIAYGWVSDGFLISVAAYSWITGFRLFPVLSNKSKNMV